MIGPAHLKLIFYLNLAVVALLVCYKVYLNFFEQDFAAVHAEQVSAIQQRLKGKEDFRFAVVGNVNNSVGVFERKIIPMLNDANLDFLVSAGNAVSGSGEDKYRALYRTLGRLEMPYLLTAGRNEMNNFGSRRFYRHMGPYFFSFASADSRFIFLDSSTTTSFSWQLLWLRELLESSESQHTFVFIGHPLLTVDRTALLDEPDDYLGNAAFRNALLALFEEFQVDAVFSANLHVYSHETRAGTDYITTGGAGGLVLNNDTSFYHFVEVSVKGDAVEVALERLDIGQHRLFKTLESLWFAVHSLFYVGHLNFLLLLCLLIVIATKLYTTVFVDKDFYPNFDLDPTPYLGRQLRVAMVTNNYLPFVGGVPISIARLKQGLAHLGHKLLTVAPYYPQHTDDANDAVLRVPSLLAFGKNREFRIANIFLPRIGRMLAQFKPDIVHLHHPVWLGSAGLFWARRLGVASIYTYHTRLEHYAHFVLLPSALFRNLIAHYLIKRFANKCDGIIVPTRAAGEYLRVIGVKRDIFVQPSGINCQRSQRVSEADTDALRRKLGLGHERVFISVSRLSREKNINFMLDALAQLKQESDKDFRLLIVGEGSERQALEARIDELGLRDNVTLVGAVPPDEVPIYYKAADAFLFASRSETQGMVILEAMAAGLPVVAVRASGIDDFVQDGVNGFKTPANIAQWQAKVAQLLRDDELLRKLGKHAWESAQKYDVEKVAANTVNIYAHILAARAAAKLVRRQA